MKNKCETIQMTLINTIEIIYILLAVKFERKFTSVEASECSFCSLKKRMLYKGIFQAKQALRCPSFINLLSITLPLYHKIVNDHITHICKEICH